MKNKIKDAEEVLRIYLKVADAFYDLQEKNGIKFTKGRLKFRGDVKKSIQLALAALEAIEYANEPRSPDNLSEKVMRVVVLKEILKKFGEFKVKNER